MLLSYYFVFHCRGLSPNPCDIVIGEEKKLEITQGPDTTFMEYSRVNACQHTDDINMVPKLIVDVSQELFIKHFPFR